MKVAKIHIGVLIVVSGLISSCDEMSLKLPWLKEEQETTREVVARVKDVFLYKDDLDGLINPNTSPTDSANIVGRYVNNWIRKQLLISEAAVNIDFDIAELERKILDYRYALMVYEYEKFYIQQKLETEVSAEEIKEYYEKNLSNFELKQNIVRGTFVKLNKQAPRIDQVRTLIKSRQKKDKEELKSYCFRFAEVYSLEDSLWINFDEIIKNTPFTSISNKVQFLKTNNYAEESDEEFLYILKINEYKISDQISPLEFVTDHIKNIILNKRKIALSKELEDRVYDRAIKNKEFEIYE